MAFPVAARTTGQLVTAAIWNADVKDNLNALQAGTQNVDGVLFAATQVASANANTLDDYEEGTWTPTDVSGASLVLAIAQGSYIKVGKMVMVTGYVQYPATADASLSKFGSLPFTCDATYYGGLAVGFSDLSIQLMVSTTSTEVIIYPVGSTTRKTNANMSGISVRFSGVYRATA